MRKILLTVFMAVIYSSFSTLRAQQYVPVLQETFSPCKSTTIQGGYFAEANFFESDKHADNPGWYSRYTYVSERSVKLGSKDKSGYITTPELVFSGTTASEIKVKFRAQLWFTGTTKDTTNLVVSVDGHPETEQVLNILQSKNVSERNIIPFELTFTNVSSGAKIKFTTVKQTGISRFFLTEVAISEKVEGNSQKTLVTSAYYHHFNNLMAGNESEERTVTIAGENLENDITIESDIDKPSFVVSKSGNWNPRTGGELAIHFVPVNAGTKEEIIRIKSGSQEQKITLTGHAKVYAPVATGASEIRDNSITCAWNPAAGIDKFVATVYTKSEKPLVASDLFISKYIEGKSSNRALEVYNGTGKAVQLKGYAMRMEQNGAGGLSSAEFKFPDITLENGKTYTIANAEYKALREVADTLIGFQSGGYSNIVTFTGDDAIGLFNPENKLIDIIGYESPDLNSTVTTVWGQDKSLYRKPGVYKSQDKFYLQEWDVYEMDYATTYGSHSMNASGIVRNIVINKEVDGSENSVLVDGLSAGTTYYYAVQGFSNNLKTHYSNEIEAKTTGGTGIEEVKENSVIYQIAGNQLWIENENAAVYNANGIQLVPVAPSTYVLSQHGVYLIHEDGKVVKIVY